MNKVVLLSLLAVISGVVLLVLTAAAGYGLSRGVIFPVTGIAMLVLGFVGLARSTWGPRESEAMDPRQKNSSHWSAEFVARERRYPNEKEYVDWLRIHGSPEDRKAINWMYRGHLD